MINYLILNIALGKYCLPDPSELTNITKPFMEQFYKNYDVEKYTAYIADLAKAWYVMAISVGVAIVVSFIYLLILRCCAGVLIWVSIFAILGAMGGGGYWLYATKDKYPVSDPTHNYMMYGSYALWGVAGFFALLSLCCCSRIRLGVAIMKVSSSFIFRTPTILVLPLVFLILVIAWIVGWTFLAVWIMSVGEPMPRPAPL
jgi:choline transporter-like protein 2/4/5